MPFSQSNKWVVAIGGTFAAIIAFMSVGYKVARAEYVLTQAEAQISRVELLEHQVTELEADAAEIRRLMHAQQDQNQFLMNRLNKLLAERTQRMTTGEG